MKKATTVTRGSKKVPIIQNLRRFSSFVLKGRRSMSTGRITEGGMDGENFHDVEGKECVVQDMSMMITVTDPEGETLPKGCLTIHNIARLLQEKTTQLPYEVSVLNNRQALIDFEKEYQS